ncbi:MAG: hypothetical protein QNL04_13775 [SAR324 cluster bacterium]|nr:hypothetical protein [SAR324 cluster bacterium]
MPSFFKLIYFILLVGYFIYVPMQAQAQDTLSQANAVVSDVEGKIAGATSIFGGQNSAGCDLNYLGTYDDVDIAYNQTKGNVAGDVVGIDGTAKGSCFFEIMGNKKEGGVQRFRYESKFGDLDPTAASIVNPLDARGDPKTQLEDKKASIQKLSSDIAPFYRMPNLVLWLKEEFYSSEIYIKSTYGSDLLFYSYDNSVDPTTLSPDNHYWVEIHLEEVLVSYDTTFPLTNKPMRLSYFDLVYQKPVLIPNASTAVRPYDIYQPQFIASGYQIDIKDLPMPLFPELTLDLSYGFSQSGTMKINASAVSLVPDEVDISLTKLGVGLDLQLSQNFHVAYRGDYMWIYLKDTALDDPLISLDAINHISMLWKF